MSVLDSVDSLLAALEPHTRRERRQVDTQRTVKLRTGALMPLLALGTWKAKPGEVQKAVECAIRNGYRNIDCANDYNNEAEVGAAIAQCIADGVVTREELFIQAKLWNTNHRHGNVRPDLVATLKDLQISYVDSFVIHWPQACPARVGAAAAVRTDGAQIAPEAKHTMFPVAADGYFAADKECRFMQSWVALEELVEEGLTKSIGVSNFNSTQLVEVIRHCAKNGNAPDKWPAVLQNECHPYLQQKDLVDLCRIHGVVLQAYSSLGSGTTHFGACDGTSGTIPLKDPLVLGLAAKYGKTAAQIILRWNVQRGVAVVAKSVHEDRIKSNAKIFDFALSAEDMEAFAGVNYGWRHLMWQATSVHPDYPFRDWLPSSFVDEKAPTKRPGGQGD